MRRTPLARVSKKRQAAGPDYDRARQAALVRDHFACQGPMRGMAGDCAGRVDPHHVEWGQARGERRNDADLIVSLCRRHHDDVHAFPLQARALGLLV